MNKDIYSKLVDLYAGDELPTELKEELEKAAFNDRDLSHEMATLRTTVELIRSQDTPEFTEESFQRILMKMYARGVDPQTKTPIPSHLQFHLPIAG